MTKKVTKKVFDGENAVRLLRRLPLNGSPSARNFMFEASPCFDQMVFGNSKAMPLFNYNRVIEIMSEAVSSQVILTFLPDNTDRNYSNK